MRKCHAHPIQRAVVAHVMLVQTVARAMTELEQEGVIRREGRKSMWLKAHPGG